ncbi:MAG: thiamine pyrophosphate-binding protein [Rhodospirillaceae bacterium]|jgi:acetolactate synthase I/II/III large subunit|nr:thiamine pyrophosphate-binding protein [Rhodospirillaceae bacterium]MBT5566377.1 thiamine pyrophosphate-binding protein [Rhodospirillaceae bacterium]MBT6088470.1 thiamine pyrophosphate-binding protein [Rhodospirillaceae bacterium]
MPDPTNRLTGGQVISRILKGYGIETAFVLAGAAHSHTLYAFEDDGMAVVSGRHETGTVGAADGYARVTGKPGIAMIAGKQGMPNAMAGIQTARMACSPVVVFASVYAEPSRESLGDEGEDPLEMAKPYAKWCRVVPTVERLAEFVHAALRAAASGRPGVAVLGVPLSVQGAMVEGDAALDPHPLHTNVSEASDDAVDAAAEMILSAERPLVLAGSGAGLSNAGRALRSLADTHRLPVLGHALGRGLVPEDHALGFSWPLAQVAAKDADAVLVVGMRLSQRIGYGLAPRFNAKAKFAQIDVVADEFGRNRIIDVPLLGDAALTVAKLNAALTAKGYKSSGDPTWVNGAMAARLARIDELGQNEDGKIHPTRIGRDLMEVMPSDAIFVGDGADALNWMHGVIRMSGERSYLDHYPLGSMGIGTALSIGAAAGERELAVQENRAPREVVLVTGDGAFGFYASEWNAAVLAGLKIVCVISNDGAWGTEKNGQINSAGRNVNCELGQASYELIAQVFGCSGERVERPDGIKPALQRAFAADGTTIINVLTDPEAGLARKQDPRLQMITFEDLPSSHKAHYSPEIA